MGSGADFDLFKISDEHRMLRDVTRQMVEDKIVPFAAAVDEEARFPQEAYDAMRELDLHAPHIPEEYEGSGADALATCIVIEEVARVRLLLVDPRRQQARDRAGAAGRERGDQA